MGSGRCFRAQQDENDLHQEIQHVIQEDQLQQSRRQAQLFAEHNKRKQSAHFFQRPGGARNGFSVEEQRQIEQAIRKAAAVAAAAGNDGGNKIMEMDILRMISGQAGDGNDEEENECAICYEELHKGPVSVLCDASNRRVCRHFYHTKCCELIQGSQIRSCPLCRQDFHHASPVPNPVQDPRGWFEAVDADGSMDLDKTEVVDALGAVFPVDPKALAKNLELLWERWDKTKSGSITLPEFVDPNDGLLQWVVANQCRLARKKALHDGIPDIRKDRQGWFNYWDADGNGELDREEVMRALLKTFRQADVGVTRSVVGALWTDFDTDNGGTIDRDEFMRANIGLLDTILANLALPAQSTAS